MRALRGNSLGLADQISLDSLLSPAFRLPLRHWQVCAGYVVRQFLARVFTPFRPAEIPGQTVASILDEVIRPPEPSLYFQGLAIPADR